MCSFLINPYILAAESAPDWESDFTGSMTWTQTGTQIAVNTTTQTLQYTNAASGYDNHVETDIGFNLQTIWCMRVYYVYSSSNIPSFPLIGATSASSQPRYNSANWIGVTHNEFNRLAGCSKPYGAGAVMPSQSGYGTSNQNMSSSTPYYIEVIRDGSTVTQRSFTDATFTTQLGSDMTDTQSFNNTYPLRYVQTATDPSGTSTRKVTGNIYYIKIWDGKTSP